MFKMRLIYFTDYKRATTLQTTKVPLQSASVYSVSMSMQDYSPYNWNGAITNDAILFVCSKYIMTSKVFGHLSHMYKCMNIIALDNNILKQALFILKKDTF